MANQLLTIQMITNEALAVLENELVAVKFVNRQYDDSFGKNGAKIGDTLNIRKPPRYIGRTGQAISIEDSVETSTPLTLNTQAGVDIQFSSSDLLLRIDDFSNRFIRPAIAAIANRVDRDMLVLMANTAYNSVGTPGTQTVTGQDLLQAGVYLDNNAAPRSTNMRSMIWNPQSQANLVASLQGLFNAPDKISEQYNTGTMGKAYGFKNSMDQNVVNRVVGPQGGTPLVNGAGQTGNVLITNGWTAAAAPRLNQGDVFTIAGVYQVNPQNRQGTGQLQNFIVTANVSSDAAGNLVIPISPAITPTGQFQNVTISPANGAALTVSGTPGMFTAMNVGFHRDAYTMASADLPLPGGVDMAARKSDPQTGISIRMIRQYNISTDQWPCRLDFLYGMAPLYPEWAVRVQK